ncbi:uncharacterized protein LOC131682701 [Topomyia yanbarensis]|uniref:uncharacterized protein LOC131682701 n=1 Tax=Topomyia yanbarensis TaxID=2498891 RepID=UPI00273BCB35|nr:uncharacterized protein LOC131682701 [Topomyia yanbarensis]
MKRPSCLNQSSQIKNIYTSFLFCVAAAALGCNQIHHSTNNMPPSSTPATVTLNCSSIAINNRECQHNITFSSVSFTDSICPAEVKYDTAVFSEFRLSSAAVAVTTSRHHSPRQRKKNITTQSSDKAAIPTNLSCRRNKTLTIRDDKVNCYLFRHRHNKLNLQAAFLAALVSILGSICPAEVLFDTAILSKFPMLPVFSAVAATWCYSSHRRNKNKPKMQRFLHAVAFIYYTSRWCNNNIIELFTVREILTSYSLQHRSNKLYIQAVFFASLLSPFPAHAASTAPRNYSCRLQINKKCQKLYTVATLATFRSFCRCNSKMPALPGCGGMNLLAAVTASSQDSTILSYCCYSRLHKQLCWSPCSCHCRDNIQLAVSTCQRTVFPRSRWLI